MLTGDQDDAYILGPGDSLSLRFLAATELSGPFNLLSDGTASLPLLGNVRLTGLTLSQASQWLETLYKRQLLRPELQLSVVAPRPLRVALVGQVSHPGLYTLSQIGNESRGDVAVTNEGLPTLVDAIAKAGGITSDADLRNVMLQRRLPGEAGAYKRTRLNLLALILEGDQQQNPFLFDGDTIRIEAAAEPVPEMIELSTTTLAPIDITVNVIGEVKGGGRIQVPANTPLVQAVLAAGGPIAWRANRGDVELVRINRNGTATREKFALNLGQGASNSKNPPLRDGDTVVVNRSGLAVASDALNAVITPLAPIINTLNFIELINNR
ncbi:MAG: polysaccharide export protein [Cyanobacteria bacterium]|nr:polysaccharide export protein [Cyanobacteriota bacterium]